MENPQHKSFYRRGKCEILELVARIHPEQPTDCEYNAVCLTCAIYATFGELLQKKTNRPNSKKP